MEVAGEEEGGVVSEESVRRSVIIYVGSEHGARERQRRKRGVHV